MKNRLIEVIREARKNMKGANSDLHREYIFADYLLNNGVIVPPCKVGDTVYVPWKYAHTEGISSLSVTSIVFDGKKPYIVTNFETGDKGFLELYNYGVFCFDDFGKTVFSKKEAAEKALGDVQE